MADPATLALAATSAAGALKGLFGGGGGSTPSSTRTEQNTAVDVFTNVTGAPISVILGDATALPLATGGDPSFPCLVGCHSWQESGTYALNVGGASGDFPYPIPQIGQSLLDRLKDALMSPVGLALLGLAGLLIVLPKR